ncbi:MAG: hypothetical protein NUW23_04995 [Firmicutes bacterium]|jgi:hypothetical protein|nr:hypothetical protein [Bacillota bacterium]
MVSDGRHDILKQALDRVALLAAENRYRAVVENARDAIIVSDFRGSALRSTTPQHGSVGAAVRISPDRI